MTDRKMTEIFWHYKYFSMIDYVEVIHTMKKLNNSISMHNLLIKKNQM